MQTININITINHVYEKYKPPKSVVNDNLAYIFSNVKFEESLPYLDHCCDIDYLGHVGDKAFGIQITGKNYSPSERMKAGFQAFTDDFHGKVFIVFSNDGEIENKEIIEEISQEIIRLSTFAVTK
ncbi:MAG: hypothetical protein U5N85_01530 [Arcicella sp.]|nr:hypothetical protein [Arcicella sp.]